MNDADVEQSSEPAAAAETATVQQSQPPPLAEQVDHDQDGRRSVPATNSGQVENLSAALECIQSHPDLSPGMRQRLAEVVERQPPEQGPPQIPLDDVLAILAETVPSQLRLAAGELSPAPHPEGEAFFSGNPADDAERQAAAVAREQLALSGLLRR